MDIQLPSAPEQHNVWDLAMQQNRILAHSKASNRQVPPSEMLSQVTLGLMNVARNVAFRNSLDEQLV